MTSRTLMIQGASSSVGKSLLTAALCRIFAQRGVRVAPFKAQNMSNNAAVCRDGSEIGRSQALQAAAAGIEPTADMNPVLLKPEADSRSQVIVAGRPWRTLGAREYFGVREQLWPEVVQALARLRAVYELVIIEGAGSPAELNLRAGEIVNMAVARHAGAPVLLVGDIDRGGVFAQLLGTLWLLDAQDREMVRGLLVNKFRGDRSLFVDGEQILRDRAGLPVVGVVPFVDGLSFPEEDAADLLVSAAGATNWNALDVAVVRLPRIANFDDFDPLRAEPGVELRYVDSVDSLGDPDAVILPGTKSTAADLGWLRATGLAHAIVRLAGRGAGVVGICGGFQMLGGAIRDPDRVESADGDVEGLGLLPGETTFVRVKSTHRVTARILESAGWLGALAGEAVSGYEIHMGQTSGDRPWLRIAREEASGQYFFDGLADERGRIWGCYLHGLFANDEFRRAWLASLEGGRARPAPVSTARGIENALDRLASIVEQSLDMKELELIIREPAGAGTSMQ
jgi:adenosylcobyric acid synthase